VFQEALGKALFIDEAYGLLSADQRGEVINKIIASMTSQAFKGNIVVIY